MDKSLVVARITAAIERRNELKMELHNIEYDLVEMANEINDMPLGEALQAGIVKYNFPITNRIYR